VAAQTGELFSRVALDREVQPIWRFRARASNDPLFDARSPLSVVDVVVYVTDVNDNFPVVRRPPRANETFLVRELLPAGHVVTRVEAIDADDGQNARLTYAIINGGRDDGSGRGGGGNGGGNRPLFVIDDVNGDVVAARDIRRADAGRYTLLIAISDGGLPRRLTTTQIVIVVNVTKTHRSASSSGGHQLDPEPAGNSLADEETPDYTVTLVMVTCCAGVVLLMMLIVGAVCVRRSFAARRRRPSTNASGTTTHKVKVNVTAGQHDNEALGDASKTSVWKRLHADHRTDVIPSSCSVSHRCKTFFTFFILVMFFNVFLTFFIFQTFFLFLKKRWQSSERQAD